MRRAGKTYSQLLQILTLEEPATVAIMVKDKNSVYIPVIKNFIESNVPMGIKCKIINMKGDVIYER